MPCRELPQGDVADDEIVSRFFPERNRKSYFSRDAGRAKRKAFEAEDHEGQLETSVYRTSQCSEEELYEITIRWVVPSRGPIFGRAELVTEQVRKLLLDTVPAKPPERHAILIGWPVAKEDRQQREIDLALASRFVPMVVPNDRDDDET